MKKQDLLSKLGRWGPWKRVEEGSGKAGCEASKIVELSQFQLKKKIDHICRG